MSKIYSLEDAKKLISDFVEEEYGNEKVDFSDLSSIDVAYTTTDDELYDVQTKILKTSLSTTFLTAISSRQKVMVLYKNCVSWHYPAFLLTG